MATASMTFNAAGDIRSSASLAASGTASYNLDFSTKLEGQITVKATPSGTVATTNGCKVEFLPRYGSTPADTTIPVLSYTIPSVASATASKTFYLGTGKYVVKVTNLDATNALSGGVEITSATVDGIA
jgi:hypothetical protein